MSPLSPVRAERGARAPSAPRPSIELGRLLRVILLTSMLLAWGRGSAGQSAQECPDNLDAQVLVLGAGISGISAAKALQENGVDDFLILEATERIGGRLRSAAFGGVTVEEGANWIHNVDATGDADEVNPMWELAQDCGLMTAFNDRADTVVYDGDGNEIDRGSLRFGAFESSYDAVHEMSRQFAALGSGEAAGPLILGDFNLTRFVGRNGDVNLRGAFTAAGWVPETPEDVFVEFSNVAGYGERLDRLGLRKFKDNAIAEQMFGGDEAFVTDTRGYAHLVRCLADAFLTDGDSRLRLNASVRAMRWDDDCVCVDVAADNGGAGAANGEDGELEPVCGRYAVATLPSGVLQDAALSDDPFVRISPPLPDWKREALALTNMTVYVKVFARFNASFWDDVEFIGRAATPPNEALQWPTFLPLSVSSGKYAPIPAGTPVLLANVPGDLGRRLARQTTEETTKEMMAVLRDVYGPDTPFPEEVFIPDLHNSPLFRGSWTVYLEGASQETVELLRAPLGGLHFCGGYTSVEFEETPLGAHLEGLRAGQLVAEKMVAN